MASKLDRIIQGDCVKELAKLDAGSVDLVFADPPFNIGYTYDAYDDKQPDEAYRDWSREWMSGVARVLKPDGAFWLAIGDDYAAELKVTATRELGLTCRNWVIWYYTFGVHCKHKFTRSHTHLFYFVKNPKKFTFNTDEIRVPSARQLVYGDKRANPKGRVPDDTWILRPQDIPESFTADSDTWYFPRVCGTFKEREGFHGCQMPERLLARIIKACSNEGEVVLDPFSGSGTTAAVAKKLGRDYIGVEMSKEYAAYTRTRLERIKPGDALDGFENPLTTVPNTANGTVRTAEGQRVRTAHAVSSNGAVARSTTRAAALSRAPQRASSKDQAEIDKAIIGAFERTHRGASTDWILAEQELGEAFLAACRSASVPGTPEGWFRRIVGLRKMRRLAHLTPMRPPRLNQKNVRDCEFASEIAASQLANRYDTSLDGMLCNPKWALEFDALAALFAPGFEPLYYRWAALNLRKKAWSALKYSHELRKSNSSRKFSRPFQLDSNGAHTAPQQPGVYLLAEAGTSGISNRLYVGECANLCEWLQTSGHRVAESLADTRKAESVTFQCMQTPTASMSKRRCLKLFQVEKLDPLLNVRAETSKVA